MIELRETDVDALIPRGLLAQETRNDKYAVLKALYGHFNQRDRHRNAKRATDRLTIKELENDVHSICELHSADRLQQDNRTMVVSSIVH